MICCKCTRTTWQHSNQYGPSGAALSRLSRLLCQAPLPLDVHGDSIADIADQHAQAAADEKPDAWILLLLHEQDAADDKENIAQNSDAGVNPAVVSYAAFDKGFHGQGRSWWMGYDTRATRRLRSITMNETCHDLARGGGSSGWFDPRPASSLGFWLRSEPFSVGPMSHSAAFLRNSLCKRFLRDHRLHGWTSRAKCSRLHRIEDNAGG